MMDPVPMTQSPFGVVTFIAAPALLTNATSVLAMSTISRMLATRDQMRHMHAQSEEGKLPEKNIDRFLEKVGRVERQADLLLRALHAIYVALAAFAGATLVTLLGAGTGGLKQAWVLDVLVAMGIILGLVGVGGLVVGCSNLFQATQISLVNIRDEADQIRERQKRN